MSKLTILMDKLGVLNGSKFTADIEVLRKQTDSYLESIILYCDKNNVDLTLVKPLLSPQIISKLTVEMEALHLITPAENKGIEF